MIGTETLHEPPLPGESVSRCCGRMLAELPRYDRIISDATLVTCGRLSDADTLLLSGQPVVLDPRHDELVYTMAVTVVALCRSDAPGSPADAVSQRGSVSLQQAHENVNAAIRELLPTDRPLAAWSSALMVAVTSRARELVGHCAG